MSTKPVNVEDYRILAHRRLPKVVFDYLEGGADDEIGIKHNREVFERYRLHKRPSWAAARGGACSRPAAGGRPGSDPRQSACADD